MKWAYLGYKLCGILYTGELSEITISPHTYPMTIEICKLQLSDSFSDKLVEKVHITGIVKWK